MIGVAYKKKRSATLRTSELLLGMARELVKKLHINRKPCSSFFPAFCQPAKPPPHTHISDAALKMGALSLWDDPDRVVGGAGQGAT